MNLTPRAVYTDGTYKELTKGARYEDIDRSRLASFCLMKDGKAIFHLVLQQGQRLIWRKRVIVTPGGREQVWHLVGWQKTIGDENIQCIAYVKDDDGYVLIAGQWEGEHILMGGVELMDFE